MELITKDVVERAVQVAVAAHAGQVRKSDGTPYVAHPLMVARILDKAGFSDAVVAAAVVHDVLEDTEVPEAKLRAQLGDEVVDIVTAVSEDKDLPWRERKERYIEAVVAAGEPVWAVSVADKIHNAQSLIAAYAVQGNVVWEKFSKPREEKMWFERTLCEELQNVWQHEILNQYQALVEQLEQLD